MSELPKGWGFSSLLDIVNLHDSRRIPLNQKQRAERQGEYPYYGANGQVDSIDDFIFDGNYILLAEDGGYFDNPSKGVAYEVSGQFWVNNHAHILSPCGEIPIRFLSYVLNSLDWMPYVGGSTRLKLTQESMRRVLIPLPPLNEQRRIVAKLDRLFARSRCAREELGRVSGLVQRYKQAVLAAAFRGDLTADWREENLLNPAIRCSSALYDPPPAIDLREYFDLPRSWVWDFVGHLSNVVRGASPRPAGDPKYFGGNIPWITVGYLTADDNPYLMIDKISTFLTEEGKKKSRFVGVGTLMLTNSGATLGVPKIITFGGCFNDGSVALLNIDHPLKLYLYYYLRFLTSRYRAIHQGAAQPNLNIEIVKSTPVPIPPIEEQKEIVNRIEKLFKAIDLIEQEHQKASKLLDRLEQATLSKAFRGELVPQDPNDEPAAVLLERIQSDRQAQPKGKAIKSKQSHR